jgi:hypothetical protein
MAGLGIKREPNNITSLRNVVYHQISKPTAFPVSTVSCRLDGATRFNRSDKECRLRAMAFTTKAPDFRLSSTSDPSDIRVSIA